ncbi:hypothetical protein ACJJTC_003017 [Scirpophaga incertulas]
MSSNEEVLDEETGALTSKNIHKRKRSRKGQADQTKWKRLRNSKARLQGHTEVKHGGPKQRFECDMLNEENRKQIFDSYWALNSREARKVYIQSLVSIHAPQYRRFSSVDSRKDKAFKLEMCRL